MQEKRDYLYWYQHIAPIIYHLHIKFEKLGLSVLLNEQGNRLCIVESQIASFLPLLILSREGVSLSYEAALLGDQYV